LPWIVVHFQDLPLGFCGYAPTCVVGATGCDPLFDRFAGVIQSNLPG
jgi:hypothetical protein